MMGLLMLLALLALPASSVQAYSGPQVIRDDHDGNPFVEWGGQMWAGVSNVNNGYDSNHMYAFEGSYPNYAYFDWYPFPNPSPTYMCPFPHIPNVSQSKDDVQYTSTPTMQSTPDIDQGQTKGWWVAGIPGNFTSSDWIEVEGDSGISSLTLTADAVSFHYNDPSC
jgi:hypothetical protein